MALSTNITMSAAVYSMKHLVHQNSGSSMMSTEIPQVCVITTAAQRLIITSFAIGEAMFLISSCYYDPAIGRLINVDNTDIFKN